jgi:hypothetical protein
LAPCRRVCMIVAARARNGEVEVTITPANLS